MGGNVGYIYVQAMSSINKLLPTFCRADKMMWVKLSQFYYVMLHSRRIALWISENRIYV